MLKDDLPTLSRSPSACVQLRIWPLSKAPDGAAFHDATCFFINFYFNLKPIFVWFGHSHILSLFHKDVEIIDTHSLSSPFK